MRSHRVRVVTPAMNAEIMASRAVGIARFLTVGAEVTKVRTFGPRAVMS
jgi:hypothetical protein